MKFEELVKKEAQKVLKLHKHNHPFFSKEAIYKEKIDEEQQIGAFVLFEQIDTDRCTEYGSGWLGDQYRHSIWVVKDNKPTYKLFEDHAWRKKDGSGRSSEIQIHEITEKGIIATAYIDNNFNKKLFDYNGNINDLPKKSKLKINYFR